MNNEIDLLSHEKIMKMHDKEIKQFATEIKKDNTTPELGKQSNRKSRLSNEKKLS